MMANSPKTIVVVGAGITGLCVAVAVQAHGFAVTIVAKDNDADTASGIAAGMIAPALEALSEPEPDKVFSRLKSAQSAWKALEHAWPVDVRAVLAAAWRDAESRYVWPQSDNASDMTTPRLKMMGVPFQALSDIELSQVAGDCDGVKVKGDWLVPAADILAALDAGFRQAGGIRIDATVADVSARSVTLEGGVVLESAGVVVAAGFGAQEMHVAVPCLAVLRPVKGHLLDLAGQGSEGVVRSPLGYLAAYGESAKFGASMQFGQYDLDIEPGVVDDLKARALQMLPDLDTRAAVARTGVRTTTPDSWPLIGRDAASGVLVATGMRRNGYIFAPYAALIMLAILGAAAMPPDADVYDPNRFTAS